jgi:prepilin signal peptidase PulO-like enzyme (type II secretory pathway)
MDSLTLIILFVFGIAIGSFLNVVTLRYDGKHFLFDAEMIGGRSHCMHCKATLRWIELVPVVSFLIQGARCRRCKARLNIQYPIVELLSGIIFVFVPFTLALATGAAGAAGGVALVAPTAPFALAATLWVAVFEALLVMALIDIRLGIIPDEMSIFLLALGILLAIVPGWQGSVVLGKVIGAAVAGVFFALLIAVTRGKGMGMGDLKLAIPLGLIFGWPDIVFMLAFSFIIGAVVGVLAVARGKNTMKGTLPFGPFLALGAATMFFWGVPILTWYFSILGVR